jgi:hypothetical protein
MPRPRHMPGRASGRGPVNDMPDDEIDQVGEKAPGGKKSKEDEADYPEIVNHGF